MTERYAVIRPLSADEELDLCLKICNFFAPTNLASNRKRLGLEVTPGKLAPLSFMDFLGDHIATHKDGGRYYYKIRDLIRRLLAEGFLEQWGGNGNNACYLFHKEGSTIQRRGVLLYGSVLGAPFVAQQIKRDLAHITGKTANGDISAGTGILVSEDAVLTCKHVVEDMTLDGSLSIHGREHRIGRAIAHKHVDVAIIYLSEPAERFLPDLAFRPAGLLEPVIVAGYPRVPFSLEPTITFQQGEISVQGFRTYLDQTVDLFTAIARPGNSGGPVVGRDGRIVGIVTQTLEEAAAHGGREKPFPFFASVPSEVIRLSVLELSEGKTQVPWEDYN